MNTNWMKAQDRKRNVVAAASTAGLYALAFAAVLIVGRFSPQGLASISDTVTVNLGAGPSGSMPRGLPNAMERPPGSPPGTAPLPAPGTPVRAPAPALSAAAQAADIQAQAALRAAAATAALPPGPPRTRTFGSVPASPTAPGSPASGAPVTSGFAGSQSGVSGGTGSVTFRGSEMGSALATTFGASSGQVGRNIYVPIYLYMPLPNKVGASIYQNILAKETFRSYYQQSGTDWVLKTQAPLPQRGDFWTMLEAAGYDPSTADFKTDKKLSPVVIDFAVGPLARGGAELVDIRLVSSSGSSDIDEAVMYGFRQASFFNKTGNAVSGEFVYSF